MLWTEYRGEDNVAEWLTFRTRNPAVLGSSPILLTLFVVRSEYNSFLQLLFSWECLPQYNIFQHLCQVFSTLSLEKPDGIVVHLKNNSH